MSLLHLQLLLFLSTLLISLSQQSQSLECSTSNPIACEIHQLNLQLAKLELVLEGSTEQLSDRSRYAEKCVNSIAEMDHQIEHLQSVLSNLKNEAAEEERVKELEIEVNQLLKASRKNNFELHILKSKAEEAENQLAAVASHAEQMANIVTELWIQIQQLEQALQDTKIRKTKLRKEIRSIRCPFFKLSRSLSESRYLKVVIEFVDRRKPDKESTWGFYVSEALKWLTRFLSAVKSYHHQLQSLVRREMQRHVVTAPLANPELIFVVASAFILFPVMSVWMLISSQWS